MSSTPVKTDYYDPDHNVIKLKYEKHDDFIELVVSHITRLLDLPGMQLEVLRGRSEDILKESSNKAQQSGKKSWSLLKKKDSKGDYLVLSDENLSQIQQLTDFLGENLETEGLFRKPGNTIRQNQLQTALGTGASIDFKKSQFQAHDAATVLKNILGQLSEPLLYPSRHFDAHVQISNMNRTDPSTNQVISDKMKKIEALQLLLLLLPTNHRKVLRAVFDLLYQTAKHQNENKMNAANLSAMFTPQLLWQKSVKAMDIHDSIHGLTDHVAFMIRHSQKIFQAPPYVRLAANCYFPSDTMDQAGTASPKMNATSLVAPSSAVKRTASERMRFKDQAQADTENAMNDLYDKVNSLPSSSKKKKIVKNFSKHEEVLKYQHKSRKRHRTFSGFLRKKPLQVAKSSEKQSYMHFSQPGDESLPKLEKQATTLDEKSSTAGSKLHSHQTTGKTPSHASLPDRFTEAVKSPKLTALSRQLRSFHKHSSSPSSSKKNDSGSSSSLLSRKLVKESQV